ncbi:hypothetical protein [Bifidobacterium tissieri]|uniref:Uncharacterized protein n=1 Tax=Bifidobacterium tissieri TaxID=1630162 RepID=A0A5M9ZM17_9BIFI|nr:hypothetical protein [Bifidobacterium tissieri]KAA8828687.1 hypothetical protein EM849_11660 [Bifidobacterium tissieri]KAA8831630.1 hypothetical protein EMO89_02575 [Bifidobacterium tissieri]
MWTLTDNITTDVYTFSDKYDLEDKLYELFDLYAYAYDDADGNGHTIKEVIDSLVDKLNRGEYPGVEEAALNITIK